MMNAKEIARGGLLAAAAVALLYIGGAAPYFGPAACIAAGVTSAVPLVRRARLRTALLLYAAASVLGLLLAPRKSVAAAYVLFCGLYPIVKFGVECYLPRHVQTGVKLAYFNLVLAVAGALVAFGLFPYIAMPGLARLAALWVGANVAFIIYDVALSRLIALLRKSLPPD
nr:hypothetical protein [uncultured Agathobaculum sp.]